MRRLAWLLPLLLVAPAAADVPFVELPEGAGIVNPGINLFEFIDWRTATVENVAPPMEQQTTAGNRVTISEEGNPDAPLFLTGGDISIRYAQPYQSDHMHIRFGLDMQVNQLTGEQGLFAAEFRALRNNGQIAVTQPILIDPVNFSGWVWDPPHLLHQSINAENLQSRTGTFQWHFAELEDTESTFSTSTATFSLWSDTYDLEPLFVPGADPSQGDLAQFSNIEYSYVDADAVRAVAVEERKDGITHKLTRVDFELTEAVVDQYGASAQLDLLPGTTFVRAVMPDGTEYTEPKPLHTNDWQATSVVSVTQQAIPQGQIQIMLPWTLHELHGPGTYSVYVERAGSSIPSTVPAVATGVVAAFAFPLIAGSFAVRPARILWRRDIPWPTYMAIFCTVLWATSLLWVALSHGMTSLLRYPLHVDNYAPMMLSLMAGAGFMASLGILELERRKRRADAAALIEGRMRNLERSNEDLRMFAQVASHDLREPLRTISVYTKHLEKYANKLDAKGKKMLAGTHAGAARMRTIVNDLYDFAKLQSGDEARFRTPLKASYDAALTSLSEQIEATGATITHDTLPAVLGAPGQIRQVFQNLIGNALKYRHPDREPTIHVTVKRQRALVRIEVSDNGLGVPAAERIRIFEPFTRAHKRGDTDGTGLGLAACKRIVEQHGGTIGVDSSEAGSTFWFTLPAA